MASRFIGLIIKNVTGDVVSLIDPNRDRQLDDPNWVRMQLMDDWQNVEMVKVTRAEWASARSDDDRKALIEARR